jgi:2-C-methyl-D-erythritol 4-phosphate cytidylyltransferase
MGGVEAVAALVLAAGRGERLGRPEPKAFVELAGQTLLERSIQAIAGSGSIGRIQPVLAAADLALFRGIAFTDDVEVAAPVIGGSERQDSMRAGLESLPADVRWVAIHDAARCLVSAEDVRRVVEAACEAGAAILAEPVRDTIKRVVNGRIVETPPRQECWAAQTPQVVRRDWLEAGLEAAAAAGRVATDDAQLVEWLGREVRVVESRRPNPKITRPEDLVAARAMLDAETREKSA